MSWTKGDLVNDAFSEIGLANYVFDLDADQLNGALNRLDALLAMWQGKGVKVGYNFTQERDGSRLDQDSGVKDWAYDAVIKSLAIRLAPTVGKVVSNETKQAAYEAYEVIEAKTLVIPSIPASGMIPRGQGQKPYRNGNQFLTPGVESDSPCDVFEDS